MRRLTAATIAVACLMLARPATHAEGQRPDGADATRQVDWPRFGFDPENTAWNPDEKKLNAVSVQGLKELWHMQTGAADDVAVVKGVLYVGGWKKMWALRPADGGIVWSIDAPDVDDFGNPGGFGPPTVVDDVVYSASNDGHIWAVRADTGAVVWKSDRVFGYASMNVVDRVLYAISRDGVTNHVIALDTATGAVRWRSAALDNSIGSWSPAVSHGLVYVGTYSGTLYAIDALNGAIHWSFDVGFGDPLAGGAHTGIINASPGIVGDTVYLGAWVQATLQAQRQGRVFALDATTGEMQWEYQELEAVNGNPVVNPERLLFPSGLKFLAVDRRSSQQLWASFAGRDRLDRDHRAQWLSPSAAGDVVYVGASDKTLYAYDVNCPDIGCQPLWSFRADDLFLFPPTVVNGMVFAQSADGMLHAFGLSTPTAMRIQGIDTPPGRSAVLRGTGFGPHAHVDLTLDGRRVHPARTDDVGAFEESVDIPPDMLPGTHTVVARENGGPTATTTVSVRVGWPFTYFDPGQTNFNPYETMIGPSNVNELHQVCEGGRLNRFAVSYGSLFWGPRAAEAPCGEYEDSRAYLPWSFMWTREIFGEPAVSSGATFIAESASGFGTLNALDAATGGTLWSRLDYNSLTPPAYGDNMLYVSGDKRSGFTDTLAAYAAASGSIRWSRPLREVASPFIGNISYVWPMAFDNGLVYVPMYSSNVGIAALDAATGATRWTVPMTTGFPAAQHIAVRDGLVFAEQAHDLTAAETSQPHTFAAIDARTGVTRWTAPIGRYYVADLAVTDRQVFIACNDGTLHALDVRSGNERWQLSLGTQTVAAANGVVYSGDFRQQLVFALDMSTGRVLATFPGDHATIADGTLYTGTHAFRR